MNISSLQKKRGLAILLLAILMLGTGSLFVLQERGSEIVSEKSEQPGPELPEQTGTELPEQSEPDLSEELVKLTMDMIAKQSVVETELEEEFAAGEYPFEEPLVVLDPYGISPLAAIAMFRTEEPCQVSLHIPAELEIDEIDFTFEKFETEHRIPIYGLYADTVNAVTLKVESRNGQIKETTLEITTAEASSEIKNRSNKYQLKNKDTYQSGLNFSASFGSNDLGKWAFDSQGKCRWYIPQKGDSLGSIFEHQTHTVDFTERGYFYIACGAQFSGRPLVLLKLDLLGKIIGTYFADNSTHHEIIETDYGTVIMLGANPETPDTEQDGVYEIDLNTGETIHFLDYKNILMRTRQVDPVVPFVLPGDWAHLNAVVPYGSDQIIVSSNFQSTVLCNDWNGNIKWMLCNPKKYPEIYKDYILTPIGDNFEYPYGQHCVTIIDDTQADNGILDILLFDNGRSRFEHKEESEKQDEEQPDCYSRMAVYRINEQNMTVQQLWSYGDDRPEIYSPWRGSAQQLDNGNYLGLFSVGEVAESIVHLAYVEVNPIGEVVWELHQEKLFEDNLLYGYRIKRLPIYSETGENLHWGIPTVNRIPQEILSQYGYETVTTSDSGSSVSEEPQNSLPASNGKDAIWQIEVNGSELQSALHSVEKVDQYIGEAIDVSHNDVPSNGMQFLLVNLTVSKQATGNIPFAWEELSLSLGGKSYFRMQDDSFLTNHGYQRLPGTELKLGSKSGWICFEVPTDAELNSARLIYQGTDNVQELPLF